MFLTQLGEETKELFLDLSIHGAKANNNFTEEQKYAIEEYSKEMGLTYTYSEVKLQLDQVLEKMKTCSQREKNIILIEIVGLIMSDNIYDTMEQEFLKKVRIELGFTEDKLIETIDAIRKLMNSYELLNDILNDDV